MGIDDPVAWFNAVPESVLDGWVAWYSVESDEVQGGDTKKMMNPMQAYEQLSEKFSR